MEIKRAQVHAKAWIPMECDHCKVRYAFQADAWGFSDTGFLGITGFLPSDETMKMMAQEDLRDKMRTAALRIPCPGCGAYAEAWVEAAKARSAKLARWPAFMGSALLLFWLAAMLLPQAPAWTVLFIVAGSWFLGGWIGSLAAARTEPNRDPAANLRIARLGIQQGTVRVEK